MEDKIRLAAQDLHLEGLFSQQSTEDAVIITHPHPLYGGDMYNPVVESVASAFRRAGYTTLRFNFRGTGLSEGSHDNGRGEQEDIRGAISFLSEKGFGSISLAGYSFGAWVNALIMQNGLSVRRSIMVSPPVAFIDFSEIGAIENLELVVTGSQDEIAPAVEIEKYLPRWNRSAVFETIEGADHFYFGFFDRLEEILLENLD